MFNLGLDNDTQESFEETLLTSHRVRTTLTIRDQNEDVMAELRPQMLSGSVQVDADADVSRSLSCVFLDPDNKLAFDSANPSDGALYADNFLEVKYGVYLSDLDEWVDVPVFWGTLTGLSRVGPEVTVEAQGKEALALDPHLVVSGYTLARGLTIQAAIQNVMARVGEERFSLAMVPGALSAARTVVPGESPWQVCSGGSEDANGLPIPSLISRSSSYLNIFYNGDGRLTAKPHNSNSVWTFDSSQLLSQPGYSYDVLSFRNSAIVTGGVHLGTTRLARAGYSLPAAHPLSPVSLARNGASRHMITFETVDTLNTDTKCRTRAQQIVEAAAFQGVEATFECLPIPHLEEGDTVTLTMDNYAVTFRLRQFTIPLTVDQPMSIGFHTRALGPGARRL